MPLFSIVTVSLNAGERLRKTVESIASQTFRDFEHIVKDGGSIDGSLDTLPVDHRFVLMKQRDEGIYDAMNQAIARCTGEFVVFLNAGDEFVDVAVLGQVADAMAKTTPIDVAYGDVIHGEFGAVVRCPERVGRFFFFRTTLCHQACFTRLGLLRDAGGFDTTLAVAADHELFARLIGSGAVARRLPVVIARYEGGGYSARPETRRARLADIAEIRRRHYSRAEQVMFGLSWGLTLPPMRRALLSARWMRPLYAATVNTAYRVLAAVQRVARWKKEWVPRDRPHNPTGGKQ